MESCNMSMKRGCKRKFNMEGCSSPVPRTKRALSPDSKKAAVRRVENGETKAHVARSYGVPESTLRGWYKKARQLENSSSTAGPSQTTTEASNLSSSTEYTRKRIRNNIDQQHSRSSRPGYDFQGTLVHNGSLDLSFSTQMSTPVSTSTSRAQLPNTNRTATSRTAVARSDALNSELSASAIYPLSSSISHMSGLSAMRVGGQFDSLRMFESTLSPAQLINLRNYVKNSSTVRSATSTQLSSEGPSLQGDNLINMMANFYANTMSGYAALDDPVNDSIWNAIKVVQQDPNLTPQYLPAATVAALAANLSRRTASSLNINGTSTSPSSSVTSTDFIDTSLNVTPTNSNIGIHNTSRSANSTGTTLNITPHTSNITEDNTSTSPNSIADTSLCVTPTTSNIRIHNTSASANATAASSSSTGTGLNITTTTSDISLNDTPNTSNITEDNASASPNSAAAGSSSTGTSLNLTPTTSNITEDNASASPNRAAAGSSSTGTSLNLTPTTSNITEDNASTSTNTTAASSSSTGTSLSLTPTTSNITEDNASTSANSTLLASPSTINTEPTTTSSALRAVQTTPSSIDNIFSSMHSPRTSNILYSELTRQRLNPDIQTENEHATNEANNTENLNARSPNVFFNQRSALDILVSNNNTNHINNNNDNNVVSREQPTVSNHHDPELLKALRCGEVFLDYFVKIGHPCMTTFLVHSMTGATNHIRESINHANCKTKRKKQQRK